MVINYHTALFNAQRLSISISGDKRPLQDFPGLLVELDVYLGSLGVQYFWVKLYILKSLCF